MLILLLSHFVRHLDDELGGEDVHKLGAIAFASTDGLLHCIIIVATHQDGVRRSTTGHRPPFLVNLDGELQRRCCRC
ncbi:hypothetical protein COP2_032590 [Malus domestica]